MNLRTSTEDLAALPTRLGSADEAQKWQGELRMGPGVVMFRGHAGDGHSHSHSVMQVALSLDGNLGMHDRFGLTIANGFIIPSGVSHRIDPVGAACVVLAYVEPESHIGRRLIERFSCVPTSIQPLTRHAAAACVAELDAEFTFHEGIERVSGALSDVASNDARRVRLDGRVVQIMRQCRYGSDDDQSIEELATSLAISSRYLRKLFEREVGMSVQRFRVWAKLRLAIESIMRGENLTHAAHAAKFCDLAHFSKTFRSVFGMSPSSILNLQMGLDHVILCEEQRTMDALPKSQYG